MILLAHYAGLNSQARLEKQVVVAYLRGTEDFELGENSIYEQIEDFMTKKSFLKKTHIVTDSVIHGECDLSGLREAIKSAIAEARSGKSVIFLVRKREYLTEDLEKFQETLLEFRELNIEIKILNEPKVGTDDIFSEYERGEYLGHL